MVIPTNMQGYLGRGLARQAAERYPDLQREYRSWCVTRGEEKATFDEAYVWVPPGEASLILLPTKRKFSQKSDSSLVSACFWILSQWPENFNIAMPPLGCGYGGLDFDDVLSHAQFYLKSERYLFVVPDQSVFGKYEESFSKASTPNAWDYDRTMEKYGGLFKREQS